MDRVTQRREAALALLGGNRRIRARAEHIVRRMGYRSALAMYERKMPGLFGKLDIPSPINGEDVVSYQPEPVADATDDVDWPALISEIGKPRRGTPAKLRKHGVVYQDYKQAYEAQASAG